VPKFEMHKPPFSLEALHPEFLCLTLTPDLTPTPGSNEAIGEIAEKRLDNFGCTVRQVLNTYLHGIYS
jgi:hypothetical protein